MTVEIKQTTRLNTQSVARTRRILVLTIAFSILLPLAGTLLLNDTLSGWHAASMPIHSTLEVMGAVFGLVLATVILFSKHKPCTSRQLKIVCALISMGMLDIFHSCVPGGESFIWLHSLAVLIGGIFFACVWLPDRERSRSQAMSTAVIVLLGSVLIGILSFGHAGWIPTMIENGQFTPIASAFNLAGGWLTILGGVAFALFYYRRQALEDLVFLFLCVLFGISGILFRYANIWEAGWWFWHVIRLGGYLLPFWLAVFAYRLAEDDSIADQIKMATAVATGDYTVNITPRHDQDALGIALHSMAISLRESQQHRNEQDWHNAASADIDDVMRGKKELSQLCTDIITCLARQLDVPIGTLSLADHENSQLILTGSFAYTKKLGTVTAFRFGEGLIGQAAQEKRRILVNEVPKDYLTMTSTLGELIPTCVLCVPFLYEGEVAGVIELGSLKTFTNLQLQFLDQTMEQIAIAIRAAQSREKLQHLLEESQSQAEELQAQQEELRVSNEELEEKNKELATQQSQHEEESRDR